MMGEASYPEDLLYHPEHDWARIDAAAGEATLGITWYAQDALGDSPDAINDDPYGEGWMVRVKLSDPGEKDALLDAKAYEASLS